MAPRDLQREVECLTLCANEAIVSLLDSFQDGTTLVLVFELMAADLADILRFVPTCLPMPVIRHIMRQLLLALDHMHALGVMHRDVKPANVLISSTGEVKLGDFGMARKMHPGAAMARDTSNTAAAAAAAAATSSDELLYTHQVQSRWYRGEAGRLPVITYIRLHLRACMHTCPHVVATENRYPLRCIIITEQLSDHAPV